MTSADQFPPDSIEVQVADGDTAEALLAEHDPAFLRYSQQRRKHFEKSFGDRCSTLLDRAHTALKISYARFALRHGTWGRDLHSYHNEGHALEILADRIDYLCQRAGQDSLAPEEWIILTLFAGMHDLRQRETPDPSQPVGANERASIAECHRIFDISGFDRITDQDIYSDLEMMIAGSTFSVKPRNDSHLSPAEAASSAGALAPNLVLQLNEQNPEWMNDNKLKRRARLTLIASDLDTANVAEPIIKYANSAVRLCREIEFRAGRDLGIESSASVINFLTNGQENYFFDLHQFDSQIGQAILGPMKEKNAPLLRELCDHMRQTFDDAKLQRTSGRMIIEEFMHKAHQISRHAIQKANH